MLSPAAEWDNLEKYPVDMLCELKVSCDKQLQSFIQKKEDDNISVRSRGPSTQRK